MLPNAFKPHQVEKRNLIRLGPKYDGGYIVHKKSLDKITSIITCGLNDDWNFEKEFLKKRDDDNAVVAVKRFKTYEYSTEPVLNYYGKMNLVKEVNGEANIDVIYDEISSYLNVIEG
jgi:adenylate kinase family enzyme